MTKRYFKRLAESDLGEGVVYLEVQDGWPSRQVEIYGEQWRGADRERSEWFADQPFSELGLEQHDEIAASEFETVWSEALNRCPQLS